LTCGGGSVGPVWGGDAELELGDAELQLERPERP
jgi:hypothetical protein